MTSVIVRCVHGLEWVCADEVASLPGVSGVRMSRRAVTVDAEDLRALAALQAARTADDVLLDAGDVPAGPDGRSAPPALAASLADLPWDAAVAAVGALRPVPDHPAVDVVAAVEGRRYNRFAVENALGPLLATRTAGTYLRRTAAGREPGDPDLTVRVFVRGDRATAALRLGRTPAHRRAWKQDAGSGTLHPPAAAALVRLAAPPAGGTLLDPFCGDGTVIVEAALARRDLSVTGTDLSPDRLAAAARNAARAGVPAGLERADAAAPGPRADAVVTNPPWSVRVDTAGALRHGFDPFWDVLPDRLRPDGRVVLLTAADLDAPAALDARGWQPALGTTLRLAGRLCHLTLAAPPGGHARLPASLGRWRERAVADGVVTPTGF